MLLESGKRVLIHEAEAIHKLSESIGDSFVSAAQHILQSSGRVVFCGLGKSGHIARKAAGTFSSTGTPSYFMHAAEALHGDLGGVTAADTVLLYSHSGETDEIVNLIPAIRATGATLFAVTARPESSLGREADLVLNTLVADEACSHNLAPTTSTTAMLALSDALAIAVMDARGFGKEDFARFHPAGTLGKRLLVTVEDAMRKLAVCAVVLPSTPCLDVLQAITKAGMGVALVGEDERLMGIISDGDLRRYLIHSDGNLSGTAGDMMTRDPSSISPDLLAYEAFEYFQHSEKKIGELPVVKNGQMVGVLSLKDLVRVGIL